MILIGQRALRGRVKLSPDGFRWAFFHRRCSWCSISICPKLTQAVVPCSLYTNFYLADEIPCCRDLSFELCAWSKLHGDYAWGDSCWSVSCKTWAEPYVAQGPGWWPAFAVASLIWGWSTKGLLLGFGSRGQETELLGREVIDLRPNAAESFSVFQVLLLVIAFVKQTVSSY